MSENILGPSCTKNPRTPLTNKAKLSQIVHQFNIIWLKSKESPDYSASLYKALSGVVSPTNAQRLRDAGVARKMLIKTTNGKVRFRTGIAQPNENMILSLIEESRNQEARPKPIAVIQKSSEFTPDEIADLKKILVFYKSLKSSFND